MVIAGVAAWFAYRPGGVPTFNRDIAPLVFSHCAPCHRPGQAAPFSLLTYADVQKRAQQTAEVTRRRYMPPWLPEPGHGDFMNVRRLTDAQLALLQRWIAAGAPEGSAADLPPAPRWPDDWQLGPPDLVVQMPQAYALAAEGSDVYRNFVLPVPLTTPRFVRAVELNPGNRKILHHAFIKVDRTPQSRRLDEKDAAPGFPGMMVPAEMPGGHFLTWQPGKMATPLPDGLSWRLDPGNDLVLQAHLNPSGKAENFQPAIGLWFTDRPPTNSCFKLPLMSYLIDIPAGASNHVVSDSFVLPADADLLAVLPHAHNLAREMHGWATLPDGATRPLLLIKNWDFNWQGDYRYAEPVFLPRGTTLHLRYTYDNSAANPRNPSQPPQRTRQGARSTDEMAELWFQLLPRQSSGRALLDEAHAAAMQRRIIEAGEYALRLDPDDFAAHAELGHLLQAQGRWDEAAAHLQAAIRLRSAADEPHCHLGLLYRHLQKPDEAMQEFQTALRLNPANDRAHSNLAFVLMEKNRLTEAGTHLRAALRLNPDDALSRSALDEITSGRLAPGATPP
jgi:hypothetical protein